LWPPCPSLAPTKFCRVKPGRPRLAVVNRDRPATPDPLETTENLVPLGQMGNRVDPEPTPAQPMSFRQRLINAHAHRQPDLGARRGHLDRQEIMGNLEDQDLTDNPEQLVPPDHLAPTAALAHLDRKDLPVTTANKVLELPDPKDLPDPLDRPDHQGLVANPVQTVNLVGLEQLAPLVIKELLANLEDPAKMAPLEHLETQDPPARARNALRLVWLLAISQLIELIPRCTVYGHYLAYQTAA